MKDGGMLMTFKKLEVPTASITDVKKSPTELFKIAEEQNTGVYVFNRDKVAGVMISQSQYETLVSALDGDLKTTKNKKIVIESQEKKEKPIQDKENEKILNHFINHSFNLKEMDDYLVTLGFITKKSSYGGVNLIENELTMNDSLIYKKRNQSKSIMLSLISESEMLYRLVSID